MKLSELLIILEDTLTENGDMEIVGMVNGDILKGIEVNCPDSDSPAYLELYAE